MACDIICLSHSSALMNKQALIALLVSIITLSAVYYQNNTHSNDLFDNWKLNFGSFMDPQEEIYRRIIFQNNLLKIQSHNSDPTQTYKMGINQFSIFSDEQFSARFLSQMIVPNSDPQIEIQDENNYTPNADIDWTTKGGVTSIKNQGQCGACWAFAATATSESWALIKTKKTFDLSEQQLVDCSSSYGNQGCNGGWPASALKYVVASGIVTEASYPYVAKQQKCQKNGGTFKINGIGYVAASCTALAASIVGQPITVAVDATNWSRYSSGVFSNCATSINHAVLLVGIVGGNWKIKNSWGASWGEKGYMRMSSGNTCGICMYQSSYAK